MVEKKLLPLPTAIESYTNQSLATFLSERKRRRITPANLKGLTDARQLKIAEYVSMIRLGLPLPSSIYNGKAGS